MTKDAKGEKEDPKVPPTSDETGEEKVAVPPTEDTEEEVVEQDGKKLVPLDALLAERKKRQELEKAKEKEPEPEPEPEEEKPEETPAPLFDWSKMFGEPEPSKETPQPPKPLQPQQPPTMEDFNEILNEKISEGKSLEALAMAFNFWNGYQDNLRSDARKLIPDYDDLPVNRVSQQEVQFFQQNPEALKGLLAKVRYGGKANMAPSPMPAPNKPATDTESAWEKQKQKWIEEGRRSALGEVGKTAGMTTEGPGGPTPAGEEYVLGEREREFFLSKGYTEDQFPELAKALKEENERLGRF